MRAAGPTQGPMQPGDFKSLRAPHCLAAAPPPQHPDWSWSGAVGGSSLLGKGRAGGEGWPRGAHSELRSLTGLGCRPAALCLGWEMNALFKRNEFCSFFERDQMCLQSGGAGLCSGSSLLSAVQPPPLQPRVSAPPSDPGARG